MGTSSEEASAVAQRREQPPGLGVSMRWREAKRSGRDQGWKITGLGDIGDVSDLEANMLG